MPPKSWKALGARINAARENTSNSNEIIQHDHARYTNHTVISSTSTSTSLSVIPTPRPLPLVLSDAGSKKVDEDVEKGISDLPDQENSSSPLLIRNEEKKKTQTSQTLDEFMNEVPTLLGYMFNHAFDEAIGHPCRCNAPGAVKSTRCYDCINYPLSCKTCYIDAHRIMPHHWAEVWDEKHGYFRRHDIAALGDDIASINLGHGGVPCPSKHATNIHFILVDTNGIHYTKIRFCQCRAAERREQLMESRLFPSTMTQPVSAFTFQVLHQYHIHHLVSKESAHDFVLSLQRLTDNVYPFKVPDMTSQFRMVMRIWCLLAAMKRLGQGNGISAILPNLREFIVHCPCCLDPYLNGEQGWQNTSRQFRHLNQTQFTADGNHHSNRYLKNTDPDDVSLFEGKAYFPHDAEYQKYIKNTADNIEEKVPCEHLTVINAQNRKKFKNMDITGIINIQCGHVFIKSSVDMQVGEKFKNTDYAFAHAIQNNKPRDPVLPLSKEDRDFMFNCDHRFSYDISCGYSVNAVKRFQEHFPNEVGFVQNTDWLIPLLHVQNHRDNCTYLFSSAYKESAGHFQGETAEQPWIELNQLAPQTRQMNNGHRQDTIIDHHSYWNWTKTTNMAYTLHRDIIIARDLFLLKHAAFKTLCKLYSDKIHEWHGADRRARTLVGKEIMCVYRQKEIEVPSRARVFQALLSEINVPKTSMECQETIPAFLNEGILIREEQKLLLGRVSAIKKASGQELKTSENELKSRRTKLETRLAKWRKLQKAIVPQLGDYVAALAVSGKGSDVPEKERLFLPSDFTEEQRIRLNLVELGQAEYKLQEGAACDAIMALRTIAKLRTALMFNKRAEARGQTANTRARAQEVEVDAQRDSQIANYASARNAMISLGLSLNSSNFPLLTIKDTYRKPTHVTRAIGDSRRIEGLIFTNSGAGSQKTQKNDVSLAFEPSLVAECDPFGTTMVFPKFSESTNHIRPPKGKKRRIDEVGEDDENDTEIDKKQYDGWIWSFRPNDKISDEEVERWAVEGDRVQWFRAEAEMQRWQEEWEIKQADFLRCIRFFKKMSEVWSTLAAQSSDSGRRAYAKRHSHMYSSMQADAMRLLIESGHGPLLMLDKEARLEQHISKTRLEYKIDYENL